MKLDLKEKTILVTGGTGSIGSELVKQLLESNADKVIVFSRDEIKHFTLKKNITDSRLKTVIGDIRNKESLNAVFNKYDIDIIYHAAAMKHVIICEDFPSECVETNVLGTENLISLASEYNVPRVITISTDKSASPVNVMGAAKFIAEKITLNANFTCVRFGNVANSRGSVIPIFIDSLLNNMPLTVTDLNATRFIMRIPEAVELILKATSLTLGGEIFILNMKSFVLGDLVEVLRDTIAPILGIEPENVKVRVTHLVPGEKLHEKLINDTEINRAFEIDNMYMVLKNCVDASNYPNIEKSNLISYSSNSVKLLSKAELESIVMEYLKQYSNANSMRWGLATSFKTHLLTSLQ